MTPAGPRPAPTRSGTHPHTWGVSSASQPAPSASAPATGGEPQAAPTGRTVGCVVTGTLHGTAEFILSVGVAPGPKLVEEEVSLRVDETTVGLSELVGPHGTRLHHAAGVPGGHVRIEYRASVRGQARPPALDPLDRIAYLRPSRYAEHDRLFQVARAEFGGLSGLGLVTAVGDWVHDNIAYISGSSRPTDGAVDTYLSRAGVCRDFAHLVIALLRAWDVPARLVSVYAPGLTPMDFHAVVEAWVDGAWHVVDATRLAPRRSMLRIATGRDAADTAFLTVQEGDFRLERLDVTAVADPALPEEDRSEAVILA